MYFILVFINHFLPTSFFQPVQTYGDQFGSYHNSHYGANGYHPLFIFDELTGDLIKAELRSGNVYTSRQVVRFVGAIYLSVKIQIICTGETMQGINKSTLFYKCKYMHCWFFDKFA